MQILSIPQARNALQAGQAILVPTETVWGLAVDATNPEAVSRFYEIKQRPIEKQSQLLVSSVDMATRWGEFPPLAYELGSSYWPGPLTLVLPSKDPRFQTVGVRVPADASVCELISQLGRPLMASSANVAGKQPPARFREIDSAITEVVAGRLAGEAGGQPPSSVVSLLHDKIEVIRQGEIAKQLWG